MERLESFRENILTEMVCQSANQTERMFFLFKYSHICFYKTTPLMSRASVLQLNVTVHLAACCR